MLVKKCFVVVALLLLCCIVRAQPPQPQALSVSGEVLKPLSLSIEDLAKLPQAKLKAKDRDNTEHEYGGVALVEILKEAGATLGGQLRGENLAKYVLVTAADNYQVLYALPELDPEFTSNVVLLATTVDGKPLPKGEGPFRLINPTDKKHARWIREIKSIKIQYAKD
ncbi:molybdopterin-dependent oxidoreductase [Chryseolinea sp. T2]|uniref:molybdopterin-dependent oxidoreductase n=1 Tax=Chryseolinea sp. T2 TaxID=3129255 RepID=UPI00307779E8